MALILTVYFTDGREREFTRADDEEATMKRSNLLEFGHEEKTEDEHLFYPPHSITKVIIKQG